MHIGKYLLVAQNFIFILKQRLELFQNLFISIYTFMNLIQQLKFAC